MTIRRTLIALPLTDALWGIDVKFIVRWSLLGLAFACPVFAQPANIGLDASRSVLTANQPRADNSYKLGSGDKVRLIVFGEPSLSGEFVVGSNGSVALPLIGDVPALNLTPAELQSRIAVLADKYVVDPRISIEVLIYRPFYILGEVNRPGEYPYASRLTVRDAIAQAQGFTYRANEHTVLIRHADQTAEQSYKLTPATPVAPGDTIRIKERWF